MNWIAACAYGMGTAAIFIDASCHGLVDKTQATAFGLYF
jgi:hypothetical protein